MAQSRQPPKRPRSVGLSARDARAEVKPVESVRPTSAGPKIAISELRTQLDALGAKVTELRAQLSAERQERHAEADAVADMLVRVAEKQAELRDAVARADGAEERAARAEAALEDARTVADAECLRAADLSVDLAAVRHLLGEERATAVETQRTLRHAREQGDRLGAAVQELERLLVQAEMDRAASEAALAAATQEVEEGRSARSRVDRIAREEIGVLRARIAELETEAARKVSEHAATLAALEQAGREREKERAAHAAASAMATENKDALVQRVRLLEGSLAEVTADKASIEAVLDAANEDAAADADKVQDLELSLAKAREELGALRVQAQELDTLAPRLEHAMSVIGSLKVKLGMREKAATEFAAELDAAKQAAAALEADLGRQLDEALRERGELASSVVRRDGQLAEMAALVESVERRMAAADALAAKTKEALEGLAKRDAEAAGIRGTAASYTRQIAEQIADVAKSIDDAKRSSKAG